MAHVLPTPAGDGTAGPRAIADSDRHRPEGLTHVDVFAPATPARAAPATPVDEAPALAVHGPFRGAAVAVGDLLGAVAVVLCVPFVILAVGIPIALGVRLLLWMGGLL